MLPLELSNSLPLFTPFSPLTSDFYYEEASMIPAKQKVRHDSTNNIRLLGYSVMRGQFYGYIGKEVSVIYIYIHLMT